VLLAGKSSNIRHVQCICTVLANPTHLTHGDGNGGVDCNSAKSSVLADETYVHTESEYALSRQK